MHFKYTTAYIITFIILNINAIVNCAFPTTITKCHYEESSCLRESIQHAFKSFAKTGIKELNLRPYDPLRVSSLKLDKNPQSPVNIELKFKDVDIIGLQQAKILRVNGFDADIRKNIEFEMNVKEIILQGPYSIDGRVLILPIVGKGRSKIVLTNVGVSVKLHPKPIEKSGQTYLSMDNIKLFLAPKHVHFDLENLFNGDKALGDNMNVFINENWSDIFNELKPDLSEAIGLVIKHYINEAFAKYPYEQYFLP